ncbi:MAG: DUF2726 domain-containing protein, partial [Acholeplasmataceae bacterium]|nr:DUF2726 domain-containing protein [Acholeplasmataceae bacterium]
ATNLQYQQNQKLIITEQLILDLINDILKAYPNLKASMHVSVNKLIRDITVFSDDEQRYLSNHLTHVDFLIYNNITKANILAIEVDGIRYHEQNEKQQLRDAIKNKAFEYIGIPLIRLKTNGSNERHQIESALNQTVNTID